MGPRSRKKQATPSSEEPEEEPSAGSAGEPPSDEEPEYKPKPSKRARAAPTKPKAGAKQAAGDAAAKDEAAGGAAAAAPKGRAKAAAGGKGEAGAKEAPAAKQAGGAKGRSSKAAGASAAGGAAAGGADDAGAGPRYYLMKSEPDEFSLDDLAAKPEQTSHWEGVRNYQARNIMRGMKVGEQALFYHSSCKVPAAVGLVQVVREAYPDHTAFDKKSKYYDEASTPENPRWWMVDVQLVRRLARPVTLAELRAEGAKGQPIADMVLINKSRLSVQPVTPAQWERIMQLEQQEAAE